MQLTKQQIKKFKRLRELEQMQRMTPIEFEQFVGWLYQERGYRVSMTVRSGDEGIDLVLLRWRKKVIVQCKRYSRTVGQPTVRDLYGSMFHAGARAAHLVTTGKFSRQAEAWAAGKPIVLIDGHDLVAWTNKERRQNQKVQGAWGQIFTGRRLLVGLAALLLVFIVAQLALW